MSTVFYDCTKCGVEVGSAQEIVWDGMKPFHPECYDPEHRGSIDIEGVDANDHDTTTLGAEARTIRAIGKQALTERSLYQSVLDEIRGAVEAEREVTNIEKNEGPLDDRR